MWPYLAPLPSLASSTMMTPSSFKLVPILLSRIPSILPSLPFLHPFPSSFLPFFLFFLCRFCAGSPSRVHDCNDQESRRHSSCLLAPLSFLSLLFYDDPRALGGYDRCPVEGWALKSHLVSELGATVASANLQFNIYLLPKGKVPIFFIHLGGSLYIFPFYFCNQTFVICDISTSPSSFLAFVAAPW